MIASKIKVGKEYGYVRTVYRKRKGENDNVVERYISMGATINRVRVVEIQKVEYHDTTYKVTVLDNADKKQISCESGNLIELWETCRDVVKAQKEREGRKAHVIEVKQKIVDAFAKHLGLEHSSRVSSYNDCLDIPFEFMMEQMKSFDSMLVNEVQDVLIAEDE